MIKSENLPSNFIAALDTISLHNVRVEKMTVNGVVEIQRLIVTPRTEITLHGHDDQWEVWILLSALKVYICLKGEEHQLINRSEEPLKVIAIKGNSDQTFDELAEFFHGMGFSVYHGSMEIK